MQSHILESILFTHYTLSEWDSNTFMSLTRPVKSAPCDAEQGYVVAMTTIPPFVIFGVTVAIR